MRTTGQCEPVSFWTIETLFQVIFGSFAAVVVAQLFICWLNEALVVTSSGVDCAFALTGGNIAIWAAAMIGACLVLSAMIYVQRKTQWDSMIRTAEPSEEEVELSNLPGSLVCEEAKKYLMSLDIIVSKLEQRYSDRKKDAAHSVKKFERARALGYFGFAVTAVGVIWSPYLFAAGIAVLAVSSAIVRQYLLDTRRLWATSTECAILIRIATGRRKQAQRLVDRVC